MPLRIAVIVEGHGEDAAIRTLLERIWYERLQSDGLQVLRPLRKAQATLLQEAGLKKAVNAAKIELDCYPPDEFQKLVLILIDSEGTLPCELAPKLLRWARESRSDADIVCVLPHPMFETWFVAAAGSLAGKNSLPMDLTIPENPEENLLGKGWIKKQLPRKYIETIDQVRFVAKMDLAQCHERSASFRKLCRELAARSPKKDSTNIPAPPNGPTP